MPVDNLGAFNDMRVHSATEQVGFNTSRLHAKPTEAYEFVIVKPSDGSDELEGSVARRHSSRSLIVRGLFLALSAPRAVP